MRNFVCLAQREEKIVLVTAAAKSTNTCGGMCTQERIPEVFRNKRGNKTASATANSSFLLEFLRLGKSFDNSPEDPLVTR